MEQVEQHHCFGGRQQVWRHTSSVLGVEMNVGVYLPPQAEHSDCPVFYWLSGLTCSEQNFITKAGAQRLAADLGVIIVAPDTSPRGDDVADDDAYDLGQGAGFYVNATQEPWAAHYQMYDYVVDELPSLINDRFPTTDQWGISGHSMGGHGALIVALKNPGRFVSVSALAPIVAPSQVPWGEKAFGAYLGDDQKTWAHWDATALIADADERLPLLIDQGTADGFLEEQLQPHRLEEAAKEAGHPLTLRRQPGYDHSFYFVATFVGDHLVHFANAL